MGTFALGEESFGVGDALCGHRNPVPMDLPNAFFKESPGSLRILLGKDVEGFLISELDPVDPLGMAGHDRESSYKITDLVANSGDA